MLAFRYLIGVSAGAVVALGSSSVATAQMVFLESESQSDSVTPIPQDAMVVSVSLLKQERSFPNAFGVALDPAANPEPPIASESTVLLGELAARSPLEDNPYRTPLTPETLVINLNPSLNPEVAQVPPPNSEPLEPGLPVDEQEPPPPILPSDPVEPGAEPLPETIDPEPGAPDLFREPDVETVPSLEVLEPSANPLLFPTEPEEVEVDALVPITLEQAIDIARRNNQEFEEARLILQRSREQLREALATLYPQLSTQIDVVRTESAAQDLNAEQQEDIFGQVQNQDEISSTLEGTLQLTYNFYTGGRRPAQIRLAEEQVRASELQLERIAEQLILDVSSAYYDLQQANAQVEIEQAAVEDAQQSLRDAQLLEEAGLGTRFSVLQAEVELASAEQDLRRAIANQQIARRALVRLLGLGQQVGVVPAEPVEIAGTWELSLEESILLAYQNRAELQEQLAQINISESQRQIALSDIRPQVSLFSSYNVLSVLDDDAGPGDGFTIGAQLEWLLYDGGAARARAAQEEENIAIAQTQFDEQRNQIRFEVEQAYFNLLANRDNIDTAELALEQAEESLRLARLRFQAGVGTQTDVINQQTALTEARGDLLDAIIEYNQSLAELQRAVSNLPDNQLFDLP